jgi:hypothetical protein
MAERQYDYFINHCQTSGQNQCHALCLLLQQAGATVWYDMQAQDLTAQGMEEGVRQSRNVIIFLSDDVMARPFCNAEQRWAKLYSCKLIGVVEKDSRHSPADFAKEKERAPADLKHILEDVEFIDYERRNYKAKSMIEEIMRRGGSVGPSPRSMQLEPEPEPEPEPIEVGVPPLDLDSWLAAIGLSKHAAQIKEYGYEQLSMLLDASMEDIEEMTKDDDLGMKKPARKTMLVQWEKLTAARD